jgi:hypothetical protein
MKDQRILEKKVKKLKPPQQEEVLGFNEFLA